MRPFPFLVARLRDWRLSAVTASFAFVLATTACAPDEVPVTIRVVDAASGETTPSRLEVTDSDHQPHVALNSIPVTFECFVSPFPEWLAPLQTETSIFNPYTGTTQFYADGAAELSLAPGRYRIRVAKGPEWRRAEQIIEVEASEGQEVTVELERWADPASEGWYGVDDHLHITRMHPDDNKRIARWMRAEGLHIANLLEMGTAAQISVTPQYAYGDAGAHRDGPLLLLTGEEHPRTHFLGHTITLGTEERVDQRAEYIVYESTFREGDRLGGVSGFAHYGMRRAHDGLAIVAPTGLVRFVEVLQFEFAYYDVWYQLLNLGFRIAPSAGTDFPCGPPSLPGRERFYARIEGEVTRSSFVEAVRAGRTFVSNGPIIDLRVDGAGPGEEVQLKAPGSVSIVGRVRFDPEQDDIEAVELVVNGEVVEITSETIAPGVIELRRDHPIHRSAWVALRASGEKIADDGPMLPRVPQPFKEAFSSIADGAGGPELMEFRNSMTRRNSAAHSGAIYLNVEGTAIGQGDDALPAAWLARLAELEDRLSDDRIGEIPILDWVPYSDGVSEEHLRRNRPALLEAIARARVYYESLIQEGR
jgi:hypothetical protein